MLDARTLSANGIFYQVLPLNDLRLSEKDLGFKSQVYAFWKDNWGPVIEGLGGQLSLDQFFRQNLIVSIRTSTEIIALHLYSFWDLKLVGTTDHSYFDDLSPMTFAALKRDKIQRLMSMEYLLVNPSWRKSKTGVAWGEVLIALGQKVMISVGAYDAAIGIARIDAGVDRMTAKVGFTTYQVMRRHGVDVGVVICRPDEIKPHPEPATEGLICELWQTRRDSAELTMPEYLRKAA